MKLPFVVSMKAWVFCSTPWQLWRLWNRIGQSVFENRKRPILIDWTTKIWIRGKTKITSLCQIFLKFWHPFLIINWSVQILYSGSIDPASADPQFLYANKLIIVVSTLITPQTEILYYLARSMSQRYCNGKTVGFIKRNWQSQKS